MLAIDKIFYGRPLQKKKKNFIVISLGNFLNFVNFFMKENPTLKSYKKRK